LTVQARREENMTQQHPRW